MGGEWSLGVALVNEIWPNKSRALLAGLIGAAANLGFLMVGLLSIGLHSFIGGVEAVLLGIGMPTAAVSRLLANSGWRFLMISGALPALLVFFIRLFVPNRESGSTKRRAEPRRTGPTAICSASRPDAWRRSRSSGAGHPQAQGRALPPSSRSPASPPPYGDFCIRVRRYLTRAIAAGSLAPHQERIVIKHMLLGAGLAGVALLGTWGSIQWAPRWAFQLEPDPSRFSREYHADRVGVRRHTLPDSCRGRRREIRTTDHVRRALRGIDSVVSPAVPGQRPVRWLLSVFDVPRRRHHGGILRMVSVVLPELFPTVVRATGQGFAYNFGRILAAVGGLQTATLMGFFGGSFPMAGSVLTVFYAVGFSDYLARTGNVRQAIARIISLIGAGFGSCLSKAFATWLLIYLFIFQVQPPIDLNHIPIGIENVNLRVAGDACLVHTHRSARLVTTFVAPLRFEVREGLSKVFRPQRKMTIFQRHALSRAECWIPGYDEVHFLIADAIPGAVKRKRGPRNFFETEHFPVERLRAREITHRDSDVVKNFKLEHGLGLFSFRFPVFAFRFSFFASHCLCHHPAQVTAADDAALKLVAIRAFPMSLQADGAPVPVARERGELATPSRHCPDPSSPNGPNVGTWLATVQSFACT